MRLVPADDTIEAWAAAALGRHLPFPRRTFGVVDRYGRIVGAHVFTGFYAGGNIEWTAVGERSLQRGIVRELARYVFGQLQCSRVTARTRRGNTIARRLLPKAGFQFEATQKRFFGPRRADDGLVFVMFRDGAERWLT